MHTSSTNGKIRLDSGNQKKERTVSELEQATDRKQKFTHTAGSRSFACVAEAEEVSSGQKVGHLYLFDITHRKKDGSPMTFELSWKNYGSGVTPTQYFGSSSQQYMPSESQAQAEVQRLGDQIAQMQESTVEQIAEVQRKYEELQ
ncbi:hypothetical protein J1N35_045733 [Gossypium stocksii]|uniref:Uncharacterized protein n=1 Tax=Gossypium stocksii TaxID=47602 RepID=A0A9D3ZGQ6_9ROSI|nr:hypothetical protein J1N35_045733 [Gossypium stocksii]